MNQNGCVGFPKGLAFDAEDDELSLRKAALSGSSSAASAGN